MYNNKRMSGRGGRSQYTSNGVSNSGTNITPNGSANVGQNQSYNTETLPQWRKITWSKEYLEHLKRDVMSFKPEEDKDVSKTRILMFGPVGAGKSSFYNTIDAIYRGRITQHASSGSAKESLTTNYTTYGIKDQNGTEMAFRLCDTRGMEERKGLHPLDCKYLLDGNIKTDYKFVPQRPISRYDQCFLSSPSADDKVHCIVFVLDATSVPVLPTKLIDNITTIQDLAKERGIPQLVVLTKIDKLCKDVKKDISFAYTSPTVSDCVDEVATLLCLEHKNVFPLKNYDNEIELDDNISILAMAALRQILNFSEDASKARREKARIEAERAHWMQKFAKAAKSQCIIL